MFNFINDIGTYETRCVGRDEFEWGFVSTAAVSDGKQPYETAIEHTSYNSGKMVIVEAYDSRKEAAEGHARWVATMTGDPIPVALADCANSELSDFFGGGEVFLRMDEAVSDA